MAQGMNWGIMSLLAVIVAPIFGEAPWPSIEWGISQPDFVTLWNEYTVFGLGMPPLMMFVTAIPTVFAAYLVVFGDVLGAKAILGEADHVRRDEKVDFNPNRSHLIFGGRNAFMSIFGPDVAMCGPQWSAMQVVITERFKGGAKAMKSIYGGVGSFRWGTNTGLLLLPVVTLVQPILGVALALTLLIQGYVSVRLGIMEARSQRDLGIAGVIGSGREELARTLGGLAPATGGTLTVFGRPARLATPGEAVSHGPAARAPHSRRGGKSAASG